MVSAACRLLPIPPEPCELHLERRPKFPPSLSFSPTAVSPRLGWNPVPTPSCWERSLKPSYNKNLFLPLLQMYFPLCGPTQFQLGGERRRRLRLWTSREIRFIEGIHHSFSN